MRIKRRALIPWFMAATVAALLTFSVFSLKRGAERTAVSFESEAPGERRVILLVVDRLTYADLRAKAGPVLLSLLERGAVALMNVRAGRPGSESGYLSLGAGARAWAGPEGNKAYHAGEHADGGPAEVVFQRHQGRLPQNEIFHLYAAVLQEKNNALEHHVIVGLLGRLLAEANLSAAVVGNADAAGPGRAAVMIAMDPSGEVPRGDVGSFVLMDDPLFPYGKRTDPEKLAAAAIEHLAASDLVVVEFGDISRLDQYWLQLAPARRAELLALAMDSLDQLLERLSPLVTGGTVLLMVTPSPPANRSGSGEQLVPFLVVSGSGPEPGLACSTTTRRPGLATNTDLPAMVLSFLRDEGGANFYGAGFGVLPATNPLAILDRFSEQAGLVFSLRPPLLKGFILALIVVLLVALAGLLLRLVPVVRLTFLLEALMLVPLVLLLLPGVMRYPLPAPFWTGVILAAAVLILVLILQPLKRKERHFFWAAIGLATSLALLADTLAGSMLQQASFLGYDPIAGARYYGVGNEYMGALIGSAILGTVALAGVWEGERLPGLRERGGVTRAGAGAVAFYLAVLLFYALIIYLLASPRFGANLGGTITAAVAFGVAWAGLIGALERWPLLILSVLLFVLFALILLWLLNIWWQPELPSHLGRFGTMVRDRGFTGFWETVARKINMNWKLIRYSIWSRAFVTLLGLFVVLSFYPSGVLRRLKREQPYLVAAATAVLVGSAAALATNDSGIVAAATLLLYAVPPVLITMIQKTLAPAGI